MIGKTAAIRDLRIFKPHSESDVHPKYLEMLASSGFQRHCGVWPLFSHIYLSAKGLSSRLRGGDRSPDLYSLSADISSNLNICSKMLQRPMAHTASLSQ